MDKDTIEMYARMFEAGVKRLRNSDGTYTEAEKIGALKTMETLAVKLRGKLEKENAKKV